MTGFPVTNTLMGLGAYPACDPQFLGMLGMHGTYEANLAMHGCDVLLDIGARFDDRVTGRLNAFSPGSRKIHADIDPSVDQQERAGRRADRRRRRPRAGRADRGLEGGRRRRPTPRRWRPGGGRSTPGARKDSLKFTQDMTPGAIIKPQYAIQRLYETDPRGDARRSSSPPRSASTRCGRRSTSISSSRTTG